MSDQRDNKRDNKRDTTGQLDVLGHQSERDRKIPLSTIGDSVPFGCPADIELSRCVPLLAKPKKRSLIRCVITNLLFGYEFRLVMHGPNDNWMAWEGDRFSELLKIHSRYSRKGFR